MNGKGDAPRPYHGDAYRSGYDAIAWARMNPWHCDICGLKRIRYYPQKHGKKSLCFKCWLRQAGRS